jgi:long-chain fatty acid transport protein
MSKSLHTRFGRAAVAVLGFAGLLAMVRDAHSAGFYLQEQSVAASGRAFAGDAAAAEDPSTIFYNPAGMTELHGRLVGETGLYVIAPNVDVSDRGSSNTVGPFTVPAGGRSSDQPFNPQLTGNLYLAAPVDDRLWLGFGVTVPFALKDQYQPDYFGRYDSTKAALETIDLAPSFAYRVAPWLSVGAGLDVQYAAGELQNAVPTSPLVSFPPNPATDGTFNTSGSDWALGYNVGVLLKPLSNLRLGISYRSGMNHTLKGTSSLVIPGVVSSSQAATASFKLPDIASVGAAYTVIPAVTLLAQVDYYGWRRFKGIQIAMADGTSQSVPQAFRNTVGGSIGVEWHVAPAWTLRSGLELDPTPTPNDARSTALPDSDRTWLAIGASYEVTEHIGIDASYAHDFAHTVSINRTDSFPALATTATVTGTANVSSNVMGLAIHFRY